MSISFSILSGELKGHKLHSPTNPATHPMSARARLALFNIVSPALAGATVLDLFSGTGALGLEALSRGAASVDFVENHAKALKSLYYNIKSLKVNNKTKVFPTSIRNFKPSKAYNIIIADPPYPIYTKNPNFVDALNVFTPFFTDFFILSHPADFRPAEINAQLLSTHAYAAAHLSIFAPPLFKNSKML